MGTERPHSTEHFGWCSDHSRTWRRLQHCCHLCVCLSVTPAVATAARTPTSSNCQPGCISLDFLAGLAGLDSTCICLTKTITDVQHGLQATKQVCWTWTTGCAVCWHTMWGPVSDQDWVNGDCLHASVSTWCCQHRRAEHKG